VAKTAPLPFDRLLAQTAFDWISVNVSQLVHEALVIANVVVVIALLPERRQLLSATPDGDLRD
jgi:hypothetical protein